MRIILICNILLSVIVSPTNSQTNYDYYKYRSYYNKAKLADAEKNYKQACSDYKEAFNYGNQYLPDNLNLEEYASALLSAGDTLASLEALKKAVVKGSDIDNIRISKKFSKKQWDLLLKEAPLLQSQYKMANIDNLGNNIAIGNLSAIDQAIRNDLIEKSLPRNLFNRLMDITDSLNFIKLKQLVIEKGANPDCFLMMHLYGDNQKYVPFYDSIFRRQIFEGKITPEFYVFWSERQRIYVAGKTTQKYGEYNFYNYKQKNYSPNKNLIEDIENVDKRRAEIGLMSLEDWAKGKEGTLPDDYIKMKAKEKPKK